MEQGDWERAELISLRRTEGGAVGGAVAIYLEGGAPGAS